jgi:hypothetical protein
VCVVVVVCPCSLLFLFVFCAVAKRTNERAKGGKKNFLFISRDVFRTTYRHANQAKKVVGVCVYCIYTLSLSLLFPVCVLVAREKSRVEDVVDCVVSPGCISFSGRRRPPSLLSIFFAFLFPSSQIL